jgi:hypothetical protein
VRARMTFFPASSEPSAPWQAGPGGSASRLTRGFSMFVENN